MAPTPYATQVNAGMDPETPLNGRRNQSGNRVKPVSEYAGSVAAAGRMIRAVVKRAAAGEVDVTDLAALRQLHDVVDDAMVATVGHLRDQGYSWADVGRALGVTRQTAQAVYGRTAEGE
jgi:hypothetical protein